MEFRAKRTQTALASALLATGLAWSLPSTAGVMHPDFEQLLYGDFAEGRGIFAPQHAGPIPIYDVNGNLRGTISQALSLSAVADGHYATMVDPSFSVSATHVTAAQNLQFGIQRSFVYNDNTLFENSAPVTPFTGEYSDLKRVFAEIPKYKDTYLKYLGNNYVAAHFDAIRNVNQIEKDFKVTRYSKLNTEAVPIALLSRPISSGEVLAHVGAGNTRVIEGNASVELTRGTPVGGFLHIDYTSQFNATDVEINGANYNSKIYYGLNYYTTFTVSGSKQLALPHSTLTNDSGSGLFAWNDSKQRWEIAAVTSRGSTAVGFGRNMLFVGNPSWAEARIKYYDDPAIHLQDGKSIVFHGQNDQNGNGYLHLVDATDHDQADDQLASDIARAKQDNDLHATHQGYRIEQERSGTAGSYFKPGVDPNAEQTPDNSTYATTSGLTRVAYHGLAWGYDYSKYGTNSTAEKYRFNHNQILQRHARNLTLVGTGSSNSYQISFATDTQVGHSTINLGAAAIRLENGKFILGDTQHVGLKSFIHAGYDITANASLTLSLNGQSDDAIHKIGAGTLTITGTGNQLSPLNIGEGTVILQREQGYASPYIKIASGRATVKLGADNQLNRRVDEQDNHVGVGFGTGGGTLDFAGFDAQQTWSDIYHLDEGARIVNSSPNQLVTFTFQPDGVRTYKGELAGNLKVIYDPSKISTGAKTWYLTGNTYLTNDMVVRNGGTVRVGDTQVARAWGTTFSDRYQTNSLVAKEITLEAKSSLSVGRNALVQGNITLGDNATLDIHNLGEWVAPSNPYQLPAQPTRERTILTGTIHTSNTSQVVVTTNAEHRVDLYSALRGTGNLYFQGQGRVNLLGDNSQFTGTVTFCGQDTSYSLNPNVLNQVSSSSSPIVNSRCVSGTQAVQPALSSNHNPQELTKLLGLNEQGQLVSAQFAPPVWDSELLTRLAKSTDQVAYQRQLEQISVAGLTQAELTASPQPATALASTVAPASRPQPTVVTFFSPSSAWNQAAKVATNSSVILHAHLNEAAQWDLQNYTGEGIFVKSGTGSLYLTNHHLHGLVYLASGSLSSNHLSGAVHIAPAGQLVVNNTPQATTSILGDLENEGRILVTDKSELLLTSNSRATVPAPRASVTSFASLTLPAHTQLYLEGNYTGNNGVIEFATNAVPNQVYIKGNVTGTTQLKVGSFTAQTARDNSRIELITAHGTIADNSFILPQGYVTGGLYDYRLTQTGNQVVLSNARMHDTESSIPSPVPIVPSNPVIPEPMLPPTPEVTPQPAQPDTELFPDSDAATQVKPELPVAPPREPEVSTEPDRGQEPPAPVQPEPLPTPSQPVLSPEPSKVDPAPSVPVQPVVPAPLEPTQPAAPQPAEPAQPTPVPTPTTPTPSKPLAPTKPQHLVLNPQDRQSPRIVQQVELDKRLVQGIPAQTTAAAQQQEEFALHNIELSEPSSATMDESDTHANANVVSPTATTPSVATAPASSDAVQAETLMLSTTPAPAAPRLVNAALGSFMANAQFLQLAAQVDLNRVLLHDGLYLNRHYEQSSLDFTGVDYDSAYSTSGWTLGYSSSAATAFRWGAWVNSASGKSQITNHVSSAQGQLQARGWGAFSSWKLVPQWQLALSYQQLGYQVKTEGAHHQQVTGTTRHYAIQVNYVGWNTQYQELRFNFRPYLAWGYSQLPSMTFTSNLGENLGQVQAQAQSLQLGLQAQVSWGRLFAQLGYTQQLRTQDLSFHDNFGKEQIALHPHNWQINTQLSYQFNSNWSAHAYYQTQAQHALYGVGVAWKW